MKRRTRRYLLSILFPERCAACGEVVAYAAGFCPRCRAALRRMEPPLCPSCGRPESLCRCGRRAAAYERCVMPFAYGGAAKQGIRRLKERGRSYTAAAFAAEMERIVRREYGGAAFTCVTPVPLHPADEKKRGFNQAALLARELAEGLDLPYRDVLEKLFETRPQKELTALERTGNLLGAFGVREEAGLADAVVLLVDDVTTTGATLMECAKMLRIYGAREVWAVTAAGTLPEE